MTDITPTALRRSVPALAVLRLGFAALLATRPGEARLVGARELALGLGTLDAYRSGAAVSGWVAAMAVADGSDALAFTIDGIREPHGRRRALVMASFAASGLVAEGLTAYALRRAGE